MIAVVDYGIEKKHPLTKALSELKIDFKITNTETEILHADKIILPQIENISFAVKQLHLLNLFTMLRLCNKPMLGISHGMHLMCAHTKENDLSCLGIFPGTVEKINDDMDKEVLIGEHEIIFLKESRLFKDINSHANFYFHHSHYLPVDNFTSAVNSTPPIYSAAAERNNFFGVQFIPEKSGEAGKMILRNFLNAAI